MCQMPRTRNRNEIDWTWSLSEIWTCKLNYKKNVYVQHFLKKATVYFRKRFLPLRLFDSHAFRCNVNCMLYIVRLMEPLTWTAVDSFGIWAESEFRSVKTPIEPLSRLHFSSKQNQLCRKKNKTSSDFQTLWTGEKVSPSQLFFIRMFIKPKTV